jgi:hypothetical protein
LSPACLQDKQAAEFQQLEADAKFMVSAQGITTGTKAHTVIEDVTIKSIQKHQTVCFIDSIHR